MPVIETHEQIAAARAATREGNAPFLTALMEGKYTDGYLQREGANAPKVESGDMKIIGSPLDFVGLNVYTPEYVRGRRLPRRVRGGKAPGFVPADGLGLAVHRPGSDLLGGSECQRSLETTGALHHRKWLFVGRCVNRLKAESKTPTG